MSSGAAVWRIYFSVIAILLTSALVMSMTLTTGDFHGSVRFDLARFLDYSVAKPFVYRVLTPFLVNTASSLTPEWLSDIMTSIWTERGLSETLGMPRTLPVQGIWTYIIILLSLMGFAVVIKKVLMTFYNIPDLIALFFSLLSLIFVPTFRSIFMYDYPTLFLFSLSWLLLLRKSWYSFYPVFALACFSKETMALIPLITLISPQMFGGKRNSWLFHSFAQFMIWLCVALFLRWLFRDNVGGVVEIHLSENLRQLINPLKYIEINKFLMPELFNLLLDVLGVYLLWTSWSSLSVLLRRAIVALIPLLVTALIFGRVVEARIFFEAYPILFAAMCCSTLRLFGMDLHDRTAMGYDGVQTRS